jgi:hypothetical protein
VATRNKNSHQLLKNRNNSARNRINPTGLRNTEIDLSRKERVLAEIGPREQLHKDIII